jgi:hypothetical protein
VDLSAARLSAGGRRTPARTAEKSKKYEAERLSIIVVIASL